MMILTARGHNMEFAWRRMVREHSFRLISIATTFCICLAPWSLSLRPIRHSRSRPVCGRQRVALSAGIPAIVSVHSINFHSTVKDFRSRTLPLLDDFLTALESKHADLLYLHDEDLRELVSQGSYQRPRAAQR